MRSLPVVKALSVLSVWACLFSAANRAFPAETGNRLWVESVTVDGKPVRWQPGADLHLGASAKNIRFNFGRTLGEGGKPLRLRYKLEGVDQDWDIGGGFMFVMLRYYNESNSLVTQTRQYQVMGESTGWDATLENSPLVHRRETLTVPNNVSRLGVILSSAGPPSTMGIYVVSDLVVSRIANNGGEPEALLRSPFDRARAADSLRQIPRGWQRDGTGPDMAKIVEVGHDPKTRAFAILDDNALNHAEWHNTSELSPRVAPGDNLVLEWNEMYSVGESHGLGDLLSKQYANLPPGHYQLRLGEETVMGRPAGQETILSVVISPPYWELPWFWAAVAALTVAGIASGVRYVSWHRVRRVMSRLDQQRMLELERVRIAQDIHDDLGARVTQISLVSGLAENDGTLSKKARDEFHRISFMSRDLVSALYETVWAVNPENDNLRAVGNYLCQMITELCAQAQLRCRLHVPPLPRQIGVSSRIRHNLSMAVKEAVHNVIKHAAASQVTVRITLESRQLLVSIQDDGCGFLPGDAPAGNGLVNMKRRLENVGGTCEVVSSPGKGTTVQLRLALESADSVPPAAPVMADAESSPKQN